MMICLVLKMLVRQGAGWFIMNTEIADGSGGFYFENRCGLYVPFIIFACAACNDCPFALAYQSTWHRSW